MKREMVPDRFPETILQNAVKHRKLPLTVVQNGSFCETLLNCLLVYFLFSAFFRSRLQFQVQPLKPPPPPKFFRIGQEAPNIKKLRGQGSLGDGPKNLLRQKIVNNLARLFFTLRNKNNLAWIFLRLFFAVILDNEKVIFGIFKAMLNVAWGIKLNLRKLKLHSRLFFCLKRFLRLFLGDNLQRLK